MTEKPQNLGTTWAQPADQHRCQLDTAGQKDDQKIETSGLRIKWNACSGLKINWCPRQDSNLRPRLRRDDTLSNWQCLLTAGSPASPGPVTAFRRTLGVGQPKRPWNMDKTFALSAGSFWQMTSSVSRNYPAPPILGFGRFELGKRFATVRLCPLGFPSVVTQLVTRPQPHLAARRVSLARVICRAVSCHKVDLLHFPCMEQQTSIIHRHCPMPLVDHRHV